MTLLRHAERGDGGPHIDESRLGAGRLPKFCEKTLDPFSGVEHQIGIGHPSDIAGGGFKFMGIDAGPDDGSDLHMRTANVPCEIGRHRGERGDGQIGSGRACRHEDQDHCREGLEVHGGDDFLSPSCLKAWNEEWSALFRAAVRQNRLAPELSLG